MRATRRSGAIAAGVAAALVMIGALVADGPASHGLDVRYRVLVEDRIEVADAVVENRIRWHNFHRPVSRYVQGWDFEAWGTPDQLPRLDVVAEGVVRVPEGPPVAIALDTGHSSVVMVDGLAADGRTFGPGDHRLQVFWFGDVQKPGSRHWWLNTLDVYFELVWGDDDRGMTLIPQSAVTPASGPWTPLRTALWIIAPLLALVAGFGLFSIVTAPTIARRRKRVAIVVSVLVMSVGLGYRLWDYSVMPEFRDNQDELFATWNGWQLLEDGTTRGWSLWPAQYGNRVQHSDLIYFRKRPIHIIRPYLEHPPALHLLAGAAAKIGGAAHWSHAKLSHTRLLPIGLNVVAMLLLVAVGRRLDPRGPAPYFALLLYAVVPIIAIQARAVKEEALLVPLVLGSFWFYLRWKQDGRRTRDLVLAAALAGACTLTKVPGFVFVPVLVMLVTGERRFREAGWAALVGVGVSALILVYAAYVDWDLFWYTNSIQATGRPVHWNIFPRFFDDPLINHNLVGRGWLLFLWLAWAMTLFRDDKRGAGLLALPVIAYIAVIAVGSGTWTFGWYLMPIHPLLCIGAGRYLADTWRSPDLVRGGLFVFLMVMYALNFTVSEEWIRQPENWRMVRNGINALALGLLVPFALAHAFRSALLDKLARLSLVAMVATFVVLSGWFVYRYDVLYESYRDFDRNVYFDR